MRPPPLKMCTLFCSPHKNVPSATDHFTREGSGVHDETAIDLLVKLQNTFTKQKINQKVLKNLLQGSDRRAPYRHIPLEKYHLGLRLPLGQCPEPHRRRVTAGLKILNKRKYTTPKKVMSFYFKTLHEPGPTLRGASNLSGQFYNLPSSQLSH